MFGQGLVFIATGFQTPALMAVRPDGKGDVTRTHVAWTITRGAPYTPSPLLVGNDLYYVSDTGVLSLADADVRTDRVAAAAGRQLFSVAGVRRRHGSTSRVKKA